eukprot:PhF_6_TR19028/c1_g1_i6/m.27935
MATKLIIAVGARFQEKGIKSTTIIGPRCGFRVLNHCNVHPWDIHHTPDDPSMLKRFWPSDDPHTRTATKMKEISKKLQQKVPDVYGVWCDRLLFHSRETNENSNRSVRCAILIPTTPVENIDMSLEVALRSVGLRIPAEDILIVSDDNSQPIGQLTLTKGTSFTLHKAVQSAIEGLRKTRGASAPEKCSYLRIGVLGQRQRDAHFTHEEYETVVNKSKSGMNGGGCVLDRAALLCKEWALRGVLERVDVTWNTSGGGRGNGFGCLPSFVEEHSRSILSGGAPNVAGIPLHL